MARRVARIVVGVLLALAAGAALAQSFDSGTLGRLGALAAAAVMGVVGVGVLRHRAWAEGAAFFLGLFWLWATLALRIQGAMSAPEVYVWLPWSLAVIIGSLRARAA